MFTNGGFSFRPVRSVLSSADGLVLGTLNIPNTLEVKGVLIMGAGSTGTGGGTIRPLACPTPVITPGMPPTGSSLAASRVIRRSRGTSEQCADEGTLGLAPGTYQLSVDVGGTLDLSGSTDARTVQSYTQDASGLTKVALSGSSMGKLIETGSHDLDRTLEVDASDGAMPHNGDIVMTAASVRPFSPQRRQRVPGPDSMSTLTPIRVRGRRP
jgi:hypothetical protein